MTPVETAKPCPSAQKKKPKLGLLLTILAAAARAYRVFKLVDTCYDWLKSHWTSVWESLKSLGDFL